MSIEVFTPIARQVVIDDQTVHVGPFKARQFAAVQMAMRPLVPVIQQDPDDLLQGHLEQTIALLAAATGADPAWLGERDPDKLLKLLGEVLEVNVDFSRRRIAPAFDRLGQKMKKIARDGASSSPDSAGSDTAATTSST